MIPVFQTTFVPDETDAEAGNCLAACVATILERDIADVPNFAAEEKWFEAFEVWCYYQGFGLVVEYPGPAASWYVSPGIFAIATGKSPRGAWNHCVVVDHFGQLAHDPNPEGGGLDGPAHDVTFLVKR